MSTTDDVRAQMISDMGELIARRAKATDEAEKAAIDTALADMNTRLEALDQMSLLQAAGAVSDISDQLARVVAAAKLDPLDSFRERLARSIDRLSDLQAAMHASEALPPADVPPPEVQAPAGAPPSLARAAGAAPAPVNSTEYSALKTEYRELYASCVTRPEFKASVAYYLKQLNRNRATYEQAVNGVGTVPWQFVGIIHAMESGFGFSTHLHNGDPLTARTVRVPAGRPLQGNPPFDWKASARDALRFKGYDKETDWSAPRMLYLLEKYNGFGYRWRGVPTPYLWSFSNHYTKGKFVEDRKFDPEKVSRQCGAALMMKAVGVA